MPASQNGSGVYYMYRGERLPRLCVQLLILGSFFPPGIMYSFHVHDLPQRGRALARAGFSSSETSLGIFQPGSVRSTLIINNAGIRTVLLPSKYGAGDGGRLER